MNNKFKRKNTNYWQKVDNSQPRSKKLDMRRTDEFQFLLSKAVESLPESVRGAIKGGIYSLASRRGSKEAKEYVIQKHTEGIIDANLEKKLIDLIFDYSKYS